MPWWEGGRWRGTAEKSREREVLGGREGRGSRGGFDGQGRQGESDRGEAGVKQRVADGESFSTKGGNLEERETCRNMMVQLKIYISFKTKKSLS